MIKKSKNVSIAVVDKKKCDDKHCKSTTEKELAEDILNSCDGTGGGLHHKIIKGRITVIVEFFK